MKKIATLILITIATASILIGCAGQFKSSDIDEEAVSHVCVDTDGICDICGTKEKIDLSEYALVYDLNESYAFKCKMLELAERINEYTSVPVSAHNTLSSENIIRVCTGNHNVITSYGYAIIRDVNTITITGTTPLLAQMGVDYFMDTYITGREISVPDLYVSDNHTMVDVSGYNTVYSQLLDNKSEKEDVITPDRDKYYGVTSETGRDFAVDVAIKSANILGAAAVQDNSSSTQSEVLVGLTNRPQTQKVLEKMDAHGFGIMFEDGYLVATGYSTAAMHMAGELLISYLEDSKVGDRVLVPADICITDEASQHWLTDVTLPDLPLYCAEDEGDGGFQYIYKGDAVNREAFDEYVSALKSEGYTIITESTIEGSRFVTFSNKERTQMIHVAYEAYSHGKDNAAGEKWTDIWGDSPTIRVATAYVRDRNVRGFLELPTPQEYADKKEIKAYKSGFFQMYYLYTSKPDVLVDYKDEFKAMGFEEIFAYNNGEHFVLEDKTSGERIEVYYTECEIKNNDVMYTHAICVSYYAPPSIDLPESEILNPIQTYTKITDSKIVSLDFSAANGVDPYYGTGFIMVLEDGRFVIVDGGDRDGGTTGDHAYAQVDNVWSVLHALYMDVYGVEPSVENPVPIAAWIITHGHNDHVNMFIDFCSRYGGNYESASLGAYVKIENLIASNPDSTMMYNTCEPFLDLMFSLPKIEHSLSNGFNFIKVQTGQTFYFANLEIETLFTHGDLAPQRIITFNDASTIQRLSFVSTQDGNGARQIDHSTESDYIKTTFLSTGDLYLWGERWLGAMYGEYLKCDMLSLSHHGGPGATMDFYNLVSASVVWMSNQKASLYGWYSTSRAWYCVVDQTFLYSPTSTDYIFIADDYHITLVLKETGPDYNGIYCATDPQKTPIQYYSVCKDDILSDSDIKDIIKQDMIENKPVAVTYN